MSEISYQLVLSTLQTVSLIVGVLYYLYIIRNSQKTRELALKAQEQTLETRQAQFYMQYVGPTLDLDLIKSSIDIASLQEWEDYDDWIKKYGPKSDLDAYASYVHI